MENDETFFKLVGIIETLLAPDGCPWDREQTMLSIRSSVVEEACELKEAIENEDNAHICEELGDLFLNAIFLSKLAEKENRFTMQEAINTVSEKLVRRHPHVFGDVSIEGSEAVKRQWEKIKESEKGKEHRKSALDSIPSGLPVINRAQKVLKKIAHKNLQIKTSFIEVESEEMLADAVLSLVLQAQLKGLDLEHALRKKLSAIEDDFRAEEMQNALDA